MFQEGFQVAVVLVVLQTQHHSTSGQMPTVERGLMLSVQLLFDCAIVCALVWNVTTNIYPRFTLHACQYTASGKYSLYCCKYARVTKPVVNISFFVEI